MKGKGGMKSEAGKYSFYSDYVRDQESVDSQAVIAW